MQAPSIAPRLFPGFRTGVHHSTAVEIPYFAGGAGPPLLLLHGFPQTRVIWHKMAGRLARRFTVVMPDLRGYGDASKLEGLADHSNYAKREMATDQIGLMRSLGFEQFGLAGHDRGARVAHRLAVDHPQAVTKLMVLDISPTLAMYEQTTQAFATAYWHWFFLIQPAPLPETMISADPEFFLARFMGNRSAGLTPFTKDAWSEYVRAASDPRCVHAMCEDYRAAAGIDLEHDRADRASGRRVSCPVRVLWGKQGVIERCFRPLEDWSRVANDVTGHALDCGHYIPEEAPEALASGIEEFFG
jgi:haloacetate dehalogenase